MFGSSIGGIAGLLPHAARAALSSLRRGLRLAAVGCAVTATLLAGSARADYSVVSQSGDPGNRVNVVFMGDGYTADQIETTYTHDINTVLTHMFDQGEDPFPRYRNFFNAYRVNIVSNQSGADDPTQGIYRDTALDASYAYGGGPQRLLYIDETKANAAMSANFGQADINADMRLITVNSSTYGGGGARYAAFAGSNTWTGELALHELGHQFSDLADEYGGGGAYPYGPTWQANITTSASGQQWSSWLGYEDGNLGTVGAYEGGGTYDTGIYRPTANSKMRTLGYAFNAVCREKIIQDIYRIVRPLDSFLDDSEPLTDPNNLWVDLVDPNVLSVKWYVNGRRVIGATGETFDPADWGYTAGSYNVMALAYDPTDWVRSQRNLLQESVAWDVVLTPEPLSATLLTVGAMVLAGRRRRA